MPDPQLPLDLPPQGDTPDDAAPSPEPAAAAEQPFGDLSEAAREAVRHPADPRLDRHLAHLGLSDESPAPRARLNAPRRDVGAELDELRGTVEALQAVADGLRAAVDAQRAAAAAVAGRLRLVLAALLVVAVVAVAAVLLALR